MTETQLDTKSFPPKTRKISMGSSSSCCTHVRPAESTSRHSTSNHRQIVVTHAGCPARTEDAAAEETRPAALEAGRMSSVVDEEVVETEDRLALLTADVKAPPAELPPPNHFLAPLMNDLEMPFRAITWRREEVKQFTESRSPTLRSSDQEIKRYATWKLKSTQE